MVIKPEGHCYIFLGLGFVCVNSFVFLMPYQFGEVALWFAIPAVVIFSIFGIPDFLTTFRTFYFEENGCTVSILGIRKFIPWDSLVICQEENFGNALTYPGSYAKKTDTGAIFSVKKKERPWWQGPKEYCMFRNPFTTFFVVYRDENAKVMVLSPHIVDREAFLTTLASFGIELKKVEKHGWLG